MICRQCQVAGFMNAEANRVVMSPAAGPIRELARSWHDNCSDKRKCCCQHIIGQILTQEQVAELRSVKIQTQEETETDRWEAEGGACIPGAAAA